MQLTLDQLLDLTSGTLLSDGAGSVFSGMASLDEADSTEVSFLGNEKYYPDYLTTRAGAVLVPAQLPADSPKPVNAALIEVANPSLAFAAVVQFFVKQAAPFTAGIHPHASVSEKAVADPASVSIGANAVIEAGAEIGKGTRIDSGVVVCAGAKVGEDCHLHANAVVRENCILGNRVILQPGCIIGSDGYGYELTDGKHLKIDQVGIVLLEDDVEIGANTTIDRARFGKTVIGEGSKIDNLVQIAHNVRIGKHCLVVAQSGIAGSTHLGNYVTLAAQAGAYGHVKISDHVTLTARGVASKNITEPGIYSGMPARPMKEDMKKQALVSRLPKMAQQLRDLQKKIEALEKEASS